MVRAYQSKSLTPVCPSAGIEDFRDRLGMLRSQTHVCTGDGQPG